MKKRLLVVIPNLGMGGAQHVFHEQLRQLSPHFEVYGCVFNRDNFFAIDHLANITSLDVPGGRNFLHKAGLFIWRISRLRALKQKLRPHLTISHLEGADYVNILSGATLTVCWIHGTKRHDRNIRGFLGVLRQRMLMPLAYRRAGRIVTVSRALAEELEGYVRGRVPITTIYNALRIDHLSEASRVPLADGFQFIADLPHLIVVHARFSQQKNLHALLSIVGNVRAHLPCKLLLIGDGELRASLIDHAKRMGLRTWNTQGSEPLNDLFDVYFTGHRSNPFQYLAHADLFIMPSSWEGFPLALCEAIMLDVPVIASDCPTGPREILRPDLGSEQAIKSGLVSPFGILMPMVDADNAIEVDQWGQAVRLLLTKKRDVNQEAKAEFCRKVSVKSNTSATLQLINDMLRPSV